MPELSKIAEDYGIFAAMFMGLLFYVLRENSKREAKYQDVIAKFANIIDVKLEALEKTICKFVKE